MSFTVAKNAWCKDIVEGIKFRTINYSGCGSADFAIDVYRRLWSWGRSDYGSAGQGNYKYDPSLPSGITRYTVPENYLIVAPRIVALEDGTIKSDWKKVLNYDDNTQALDMEGRLWGAGLAQGDTGDNCASFGLTNDAGEDEYEWKVGTSARAGYQYCFFNFTRCAPGYTFKDFSNQQYFTTLIGDDSKLYFMGTDYQYGLDGNPQAASNVTYNTPTRVANVDDDIKLLPIVGLDYMPGLYAFVTIDNKVYGVGEDAAYNYIEDIGTVDWNAPLIFDITRNLPDIAISNISLGYNVFVTLDDGSVWGMGSGFMFPDDVASVYEWKKLELSNIVSCGQSNSGAFAVDHDGRVFAWGRCYYGTGVQVADCMNAFPVAADRVTSKFWKSIQYNDNHRAWVGVDKAGILWAWGRQFNAPHLGIGTLYGEEYNTALGIDLDPVYEVCSPVKCIVEPQRTVDFHWPRAVPTPTPDYHDRS